MTVTVVPAEEWHIDAIAAHARQGDIDELWASGRTTPAIALRQGFESSSRAWTAMEGDAPVAMFGARPFSILGGMGTAWMIATRALDRKSVQKALLRISPPYTDSMAEEFPALLYNFVDARNQAAIRWLKWLGFQFADPIPYGEDAMPFFPFYKSRQASPAPSG